MRCRILLAVSHTVERVLPLRPDRLKSCRYQQISRHEARPARQYANTATKILHLIERRLGLRRIVIHGIFFSGRQHARPPAMQWFFTLVLLRISPYSRRLSYIESPSVLERHRNRRGKYLAQTFYRYGENNAAYDASWILLAIIKTGAIIPRFLLSYWRHRDGKRWASKCRRRQF